MIAFKGMLGMERWASFLGQSSFAFAVFFSYFVGSTAKKGEKWGSSQTRLSWRPYAHIGYPKEGVRSMASQHVIKRLISKRNSLKMLSTG
jgi:hypothetical protein